MVTVGAGKPCQGTLKVYAALFLPRRSAGKTLQAVRGVRSGLWLLQVVCRALSCHEPLANTVSKSCILAHPKICKHNLPLAKHSVTHTLRTKQFNTYRSYLGRKTLKFSKLLRTLMTIFFYLSNNTTTRYKITDHSCLFHRPEQSEVRKAHDPSEKSQITITFVTGSYVDFTNANSTKLQLWFAFAILADHTKAILFPGIRRPIKILVKCWTIRHLPRKVIAPKRTNFAGQRPAQKLGQASWSTVGLSLPDQMCRHSPHQGRELVLCGVSLIASRF